MGMRKMVIGRKSQSSSVSSRARTAGRLSSGRQDGGGNPGYRPGAMARTPWGDATQLRDRKLRPGRGTPREEAEKNQRERLFAAMVATVAEKGYEATTVADLVELSGVSRSAFYRHFDDKQACFLAAVEAIVDPTLARIRGDQSVAAGVERARQAFDSLLRLIVSQPAASKMCIVEVYAAGPEGAALVDRTLDSITAIAIQLLEQVPERQGMPAD